VISTLKEFLKLESASGILLVVATVLAMIVENSSAKPLYDALLGTPVAVQVGNLIVAKPLLLWINDGLMAVFFFLVGLEIKREVMEGELSDASRIALPAIAAVGGVAVPAAIYAWVNWGDAMAIKGWAIPAATDIAFALGVLSLLGSRVPVALKVFLLTLAIIDDLGAIVIIAVFYTADLSIESLAVAGGLIAVLAILSLRRVVAVVPYILVGVLMWIAVLKSGVHATLAGVVLALFIPMRAPGDDGHSPLRRLEHDLHPSVAFGILPLFAFANTGIALDGLSLDAFMAPVPVGIALGLFVGKQVGVFGFAWLAVQTGLARMPHGVRWLDLYGVSVLCGIGFTMSLFISSLAFEQGGPDVMVEDRVGILAGSLVSAVIGYLILRLSLRGRAAPAEAAEQPL
jgi:NhaA family Na+:H+ antiporter